MLKERVGIVIRCELDPIKVRLPLQKPVWLLAVLAHLGSTVAQLDNRKRPERGSSHLSSGSTDSKPTPRVSQMIQWGRL